MLALHHFMFEIDQQLGAFTDRLNAVVRQILQSTNQRFAIATQMHVGTTVQPLAVAGGGVQRHFQRFRQAILQILNGDVIIQGQLAFHEQQHVLNLSLDVIESAG